MEELKTVFTTVGSTQFAELVKAITTKEALNTFKDNGYTNIVIQYGSYYSLNNHRGPEPKLEEGVLGMELRAFKYTQEMAQELANAQLIICHCGAGTLLDVLRAKKKGIGVVNTSLMDNHQVQLATELHKEAYIALAADHNDLLKNVRDDDNA